MFKVSARTILELGSELISSDIIAFYELIKNGFDARTRNGVEIHFNVALRRNDFLILQNIAAQKNRSLEELKSAALGRLNPNAGDELLEETESKIRAAKDEEDFVAKLKQVYRLGNIVVSDTGSGMTVDDLRQNFLTIGT